MTTTVVALPKVIEAQPIQARPTFELRRWALILLVTVIAVIVHGYHPYSEDAGIYVPAIKKLLNPALYPYEAQFFLAPARLSLFSNIVAGSVRLTHVPLSWALLLWHIGTLAMLLAGCLRLCFLCFEEESSAWCGTLLVAAFLTVPIAGSSLMLADPYLTSRSMSTPALIFSLCFLLEGRIFKAALLFLFAFVVHPLMAAYGGVFLLSVYAVRKQRWWMLSGMATCIAGAAMVSLQEAKHFVVPGSYQVAVVSRSYFFLSQWKWYEIVGIIAPLCFSAWVVWRERRLLVCRLGSCALAAFLNGAFFFLLAMIVTRTPVQLAIARFQPMRSFHLLYIVMFLLPVNVVVQKILDTKPSLVPVLLIGVCCAMFMAQRSTFPATTHLEVPGVRSDNPWRKAFDWVRSNTPRDSFFALDPDYMDEGAEDRLGFSAVAERSALANRTKDGGVVAVFPELAEEWSKDLAEANGSKEIRAGQNALSLQKAGVTWIVTGPTTDTGLNCPFRDSAVAVCNLPHLSRQVSR